MAHIRQSIRDNAVTAVTGLSITGSNVFRSRGYPLGTNKLPALCVYTDSEVVEYNRLDRVSRVELRRCVAICESTEGMSRRQFRRRILIPITG